METKVKIKVKKADVAERWIRAMKKQCAEYDRLNQRKVVNMTTQVTITTTKMNITAQKMRAAISMALACSKDNDYDGLRVALKQLDDANAEFKQAVI